MLSVAARTNIQKGRKAEMRFADWLKAHRVPFMYIDQAMATTSPDLNYHFGGKRPDYLLLVPNFGTVFVDVKNRKIHPDYDSISLDFEETERYIKLQRQFNLVVWYAVTSGRFQFKRWFWIPASDVPTSARGEYTQHVAWGFFPVALDKFTEVKDRDPLLKVIQRGVA